MRIGITIIGGMSRMDDETKQWLDSFEKRKLSTFDRDLMYCKDSPEEHEKKVKIIEKLCHLVKICLKERENDDVQE